MDDEMIPSAFTDTHYGYLYRLGQARCLLRFADFHGYGGSIAMVAQAERHLPAAFAAQCLDHDGKLHCDVVPGDAEFEERVLALLADMTEEHRIAEERAR